MGSLPDERRNLAHELEVALEACRQYRAELAVAEATLERQREALEQFRAALSVSEEQ